MKNQNLQIGNIVSIRTDRLSWHHWEAAKVTDIDGADIYLTFVDGGRQAESPARQCECGEVFFPSGGEYARCDDCMGSQLSAAEEMTVPGYDC